MKQTKFTWMKAVLGAVLAAVLLPSVAACGQTGSGTGSGTGTGGGSGNETPDPSVTEKADWEEDGALKILAIGNSLTEDTIQWTYYIAKGLGIENVKMALLWSGGLSLADHVRFSSADSGSYELRINENGRWTSQLGYKMSDALALDDWDFISLQQHGAQSGQPNTYGTALTSLIRYVKARSDAKLLWNMTWAYGGTLVDQVLVESYQNWYNSDQNTMYQAIVDSVQQQIVPKEDFYAIVANGTAIQNARTSFLGDTLNRDGCHLTLEMGRYIAGLNLIATATGLPFDKIKYAPMNSLQEKQVAIEAVTNAIKDHFHVTPSTYTTKP